MAVISYTQHELQTDIETLYKRGYSRALRALPAKGPYTLEHCRAALRVAGFSDEEIDARDYFRASE